MLVPLIVPLAVPMTSPPVGTVMLTEEPLTVPDSGTLPPAVVAIPFRVAPVLTRFQVPDDAPV
jgi:hypothetical protein